MTVDNPTPAPYNGGMKTPFPGTDPYLEHPSLWPDVHNSLIAAIRDALSPMVAPKYYISLERRAHLLTPDDIVFIGRPDLAVVREGGVLAPTALTEENGVYNVEVPLTDEVEETFLEIHEVKSGKLITIIELLSPANKLSERGREQYERKRAQILLTQTSLVEIDLLRAGVPMPVVHQPAAGDYRILISRGWQRPRAQLYAFSLRRPIPQIPVPLTKGETEPLLDLNTVLHDLYARARFDLRLDYSVPPAPPLQEANVPWAQSLIAAAAG